MRGGRWRVWCTAGILAASVTMSTRAWPTRSDLSDSVTIHILKARHQLRLQQGEQVLHECPVALGKDPTAGKLLRGDGRTPEGRYYICEKRPQSRFHRFLGISYPNIDDAERAYSDHLISADEWADIFFANLQHGTPPWSTALGGRVGIHGYGGRPNLPIDWTEGCIAVSDAEIDYLYETVPLGTPVIIED